MPRLRPPTKEQRIALATRLRLGEASSCPDACAWITLRDGTRYGSEYVYVLGTYIGTLSRRRGGHFAWHSPGRPFLNPSGRMNTYLACVLAYLERD